ncbi:MAG: T9SS type A sorting domain-containing protein [Ignavibacteria bacterium]|nr:T9SS type A sorting domain-containing protein [Ignavibacteria bacterium]
MKKILSLSMLLLCLTAFTAGTNAAPLTGTLNIPGDYGTLAIAISDLNLQGVGVGGVTLNVLAGNPQSAPAGGYVIGGTGSAVLTTSSALNPILIMGNDNLVTASAALTAGALNDGIFKLIGADYVTIKRFGMTENAANSTTTAASNNMTEWGVALLYVTTTDGAQNNTIDSCTITLKRIYQNTFGIYSNSTHSSTSVTTSATATTSNGGNSNLSIYNNQINNVNIGIVVVGPTAAADHNQGLDIGGTAVSKANRITDYGTTGTFSGYANVSGTVNGILVRNTVNFNVSNNTVRSSIGGTTAGTLRSIYVPSFTNAPTGAITNTISKNTISVQHGLATGTLQGINVESSTGNATSTIIIRENEIDTMNYVAVSPSGTVTAISQGTSTFNQTISRNNFKNLIVNTSGSFTFVSNAMTLLIGATMNIDSNKVITGFTKSGAGGTVTFFNSNASSVNGSFVNMIGNDISNVTVNGSAGFVGISNTDGASSTNGPLKNINYNKISGISNATGTITPMSVNFSGPSSNVNNNTISNITWGAAVTCMNIGGSNQSTITVSGNLIDPVTTNTGTVIGITTSANGIKLFKNKIYDLTSNNSTGSVNGMAITGGTLVDVYNNLIGNLYTPITSSTSDNLRGINITSATTLSNINLSYNTIYLNASSSGANFSSTGVYHTTSTTATTGQLNMRNNIIVNLSTPAGTGLTVAYRRSSSATANYGSTSNNNLFYANIPGAANLIYYDLTNSFSALSAYKAFIVAPRDAQSVTENPNFKSTVGSSADFLHINELIPTQIESGATTVAGITDDYDSQARYPNAGYPNNISFPATNPDIGADEFGGIPLDIVGPVISYTPLLDTCGYNSRNFYGVGITDASGVASGANAPRVYWSVNAGPWSSAATVSGTSPYDFIIATAGLVDGDEISYFVIAQDVNGNISANPGTGLVATDVNNISTFPSNPNKYKAICTNDAGVIASSLNPIKTYSLGKGYDFTATVKNLGSATQTVIPVYYTVNAGPAIGPVYTTGPIPQNGTEVVTFSGGFAYVPLAAGANAIQIYTVLAGDITPANDALNVNLFVSTKINTFPYVQNFTSPTDWNVVIESNVGTSPIWGLAPCVNPDGVAADNAVVADFYSASSGRVEILRSPEMDLSLLTNPTLDFYVAYKSYTNNANDTMQVLVSTDGGVTFFNAATTWKKYKDLVPSLATLPNSGTEYVPTGELEWRHETIDLSNVAGNSNVVIGFRGLSKFGNNGWIDNVIVSNVDSLCLSNVTATGTYSCNPYLSLNFTAMPAPPPVSNPDNGTAIAKQNADTRNMTPFHTENVSVKVIDNGNTDNPTGGTAFVSRTNNNDPGQSVEVNITATPPSGPAYTPTYVYHDYWFTTTYTGNDYTGYATYDIEIDLDGLVFADPTKLYIVKRTDRTGKWICQNTTLSLNKLKVSGLTDFCDFALAGDEALPVELASFTSSINRRDVTLNWTTAAESNNSGFDIERKSADGQWSRVGNVAGHGTTMTPVNYTFTERNLATGKYNYRLKQIDFNGNFEYFSLNNEVNIGIPEKYDLSQNYPNPFNPSTKISFDIPVDGKVSMKIFDMSGKEVATLVNDFRTAGYYTVDFNASALSSGIYFYKISAGNFTATKKMMLVK